MTPVFVRPAREGDRIPLPGQPGVELPQEGRLVDADEPFWLQLLADGSVLRADPPATSPLATSPLAAPARAGK